MKNPLLPKRPFVRVLLGGYWNSAPGIMRSASRSNIPLKTRDIGIGLRLFRSEENS